MVTTRDHNGPPPTPPKFDQGGCAPPNETGPRECAHQKKILKKKICVTQMYTHTFSPAEILNTHVQNVYTMCDTNCTEKKNILRAHTPQM